MVMLDRIYREIESYADVEKSRAMQRYFKTGKGEYGEGEVFLGIAMPVCRNIAKKYKLGLYEIGELLKSREHEKRTIALLILIDLYKTTGQKDEVVHFYLDNTTYINNWDLVDLSCTIIGDYVYHNEDYTILRHLSRSDNLWEVRISIVAMLVFARHDKNDIIFKIITAVLTRQ